MQIEICQINKTICLEAKLPADCVKPVICPKKAAFTLPLLLLSFEIRLTPSSWYYRIYVYILKIIPLARSTWRHINYTIPNIDWTLQHISIWIIPFEISIWSHTIFPYELYHSKYQLGIKVLYTVYHYDYTTRNINLTSQDVSLRIILLEISTCHHRRYPYELYLSKHRLNITGDIQKNSTTWNINLALL